MGLCIALMLLFGFALNYAITAVQPLMPESYPTAIRSTGTSWCQAFARFGGSASSIVLGGAFSDSSDSFGLIRGGHVDAVVLGGLEVDQEGSLANWIIPGKKMPGMGGAMDLLVGAKKVIVAMEHTAKGNPKILTKCRLPYTAVHCVDMIVTEMGVMDVTPEGIVLREYNPEFTVEQIQAATEAKLIISPDLKPMA